MSVADLLERPQYSILQAEKDVLLLGEMRRLTDHHRCASPEYDSILRALGTEKQAASIAEVPYLPVSLFKTHLLRSVPEEQVFKTLTSSGTTGQAVSRITLDRPTADLQTRALATIMTTLLGPRRLPMIIIDTPNVVRDRRLFSARGAGVLGMASFGRKHFYALDDDMDLDVSGLERFLMENKGQELLIFGFTFMAWKYLLEKLRVIEVDLSQATLIHSGGWKRLTDQSVTNSKFKEAFERHTGLTRVHDFYGMVEQVGGVFLEASDGFLRAPNFADVLVRDPLTWRVQANGEPGVIQVVSALPTSYPGHSLLTEDLGVIHGIEASAKRWRGKRIEVIGRVPKAELRGCSDTHAAQVGQ